METKLPRINAYQCQKCSVFRITLDVDEGITPFMLKCPDPKCGGIGESRFYRIPDHIRPQLNPTHEWYKPDDRELASLSEGSKEHVEKGGLLIRPISDRGHQIMAEYFAALAARLTQDNNKENTDDN